MNGLCDMLIGKEELLLDCKMRCEVVRRHVRLRKSEGYKQFSNSNKASLCRSFMDVRNSRLLMVDNGEQAETLR